MADDLFSSFSKPPPPSSARPADSTQLDSSQPLLNAPASSTKPGVKRALSPASHAAPLTADSLKKLKTDSTANPDKVEEGTARVGKAGEGEVKEEKYVATDELEITAKTTFKTSQGLQGGALKEGEEEGLVLQHQVRFQLSRIGRAGCTARSDAAKVAGVVAFWSTRSSTDLSSSSGPPSSRPPSQLPLHSYLLPCPSRRARPYLPLRARPFPKSLRRLDPAQ